MTSASTTTIGLTRTGQHLVI